MALRAPLVVVDGRVQQLQVGDTLSDVQPLDADLTAIAVLSDTGGWAKRTGADTWAISTPTAADVSADPVGTAATAVGTHAAISAAHHARYIDAEAIAAIQGDASWNATNWDTAFGWGDHASGGYLKADGTVPLTGDWTTGAFSIIGSNHWYMRSDSGKLFLGESDDCSVTYNGTNMVFNSQEVGTGGFHFVGGNVGVGLAPAITAGVNVARVADHNGTFATALDAVIDYGSSGSGNMTFSVYGFRGEGATAAAYDGNMTGKLIGVETIANHYGTGTLSGVYGNRVRVTTRNGSGPITTGVGTYISFTQYASGGAWTNAYGIYVENINVGSSNNYAIWTSGGLSYFKDAVGIGVSSPDEKLQIVGNIHVDDNYKMIFGTGKDATIYYDATNMVFNSQEVGTGGFYFANGTIGVGTVPLARVGFNCVFTSEDTASPVFGLASSVMYGSAGSGNTAESIYGSQGFVQTVAAYDGDVTGVVYGAEFVASHYGTGTLSEVWGGQFRVVLQVDAGDIVDAVGGHFEITDLSGVGAITNAYGLYVEDIDVGTTLNYAIYTGAGDVRFGDDAEVVGTLQAGGYKSSDGTAGVTADVAVAKVGGGTRTFTFKNGLYISYADS